MRILLISAAQIDTRYLRKGLEQAGYVVDLAPDADDGLLRIGDSDYDAVVADFGNVDDQALGWIEQLAEVSEGDPVVVITPELPPESRVQLLRSGADVLVDRPFVFSEFMARLEAALRRRHQRPALEKFELGELKLDSALQTASWSAAPLPLRRREFLILECLARNADRVVERQEIIDYVWGGDFEPRSNVVDLYVSRLRQKLHAVSLRPILLTVPGHGYRLVCDPESATGSAEIRGN